MNIALILAGGSGERMAADLPKQFLPLAGRPMLLRTLDVFESHPSVDRIRVVCAPAWTDYLQTLLKAESYRKLDGQHPILKGGRDRRESSHLGVEFLWQEGTPDDIVLIHDAARPFVSPQVISDCITSAKEHHACVAVVPVTDTIYQSENGNSIDAIPERRMLYAAQTPQAFRLSLIHQAHLAWRGEPVTDDAGLLLAQGIPVRLVAGDVRNQKLTNPADLPAAELYFSENSLK